jgi:hypothetical protein
MNQQFTGLLLCWLLSGQSLLAQPAAELRAALVPPGRTPAETAVRIGRGLIGRPYVAYTLDHTDDETLVVDLRRFDCQTFVESTLALALAEHDPATHHDTARLDIAFRRNLTRLRYRHGRIDGYASRLHYLSDWFRDNEQKGILRDVTQDVGGVQVSKSLSYMTQSPAKYPQLSDRMVLRQVAMVEQSLSRQVFWFIPKGSLRVVEDQLREGDVVMLTAARPGLDARHVGFVVRQNGRAHLLHASSDLGQVTLTTQPLADYVMSHKRMSGIRVARLVQRVNDK